jgi:DNA-binding LacI/PurR family transcriptional regulator
MAAGDRQEGDVPGSSHGGAVTMRDIARALGISRSTVSRVLNSAPSVVPIAPATRERVLAAADSLHYTPNPLARGLRGAGTMLLGVIVREITDVFFASAIEAVSTEAMARGYNVVLGHAHGRADEAILIRSVLETRACDAILLLGDMSDQPRLLEDLKGSRVRIVALWQGSVFHGVSVVSVDNHAGVSLTLDHLLALGHRRIAFVAGLPLGDIEERQATFAERLHAEGLEIPDGYIRREPNNPAGGQQALAALLELPIRPTAVVCSSDQLAMGVLRGAATCGLCVPEDLSVTGFDDLPFSAFMVPTLTTVRMPIAAMAARAVQIALEPKTDARGGLVEVFQPQLVIRQSTGTPLDHPPLPVVSGPRSARNAGGGGET